MKKYLLTGLFFCLFIPLFSTGKKEVTLGYVGNLSGRGSELWVNARNGLQLAIDEYNNEDGNFHITLKVLDDKGEPELSQKAAEELLSENISLCFGPTTSAHAESIKSFFDNEDILFFSGTVSSELFKGKKDSLFRVVGSAKLQGTQLAQLAKNREGDESYVMLYDLSNETYTSQVINGFIEEVGEENCLGILPYNGQGEDAVLSLVRQVLDWDPDGLLIAGSDLDAAAIIQQVYKENETIHFYTPSWANTEDFIMNAGKACEGSYQIGTFDYSSTNPDYVYFRESYLRAFGSEPLFTASRYYDLFNMLKPVLADLKKWNIEEIKDGLLKAGSYSSFQGTVQFDPYGDADAPYVIQQIIGGQQVVIP